MKLKFSVYRMFSTSLNVIVATWLALYLIGQFDLIETLSEYLNIAQATLKLAVPVTIFLVASVIFAITDKTRREEYEASGADDKIISSVVYYFKSYFLPDAISSVINAFVFIIMTFLGTLTPISSFIFLGLFFWFIFGSLFLFAIQLFASFIGILVRCLLKKHRPGQILCGMTSGVIIAISSVALGAIIAVAATLTFGIVLLFGLELAPQVEEAAGNILVELSFLAAPPFAWSIIYSLRTNRKNEFLMETEGLIPIKDGIAFHRKRYAKDDIACMITVFVVLAVSVFVPAGISPLMFLCNIGGIYLAIPIGALMMYPCMIYGIYGSQMRWRKQFILDIFGCESRRI